MALLQNHEKHKYDFSPKHCSCGFFLVIIKLSHTVTRERQKRGHSRSAGPNPRQQLGPDARRPGGRHGTQDGHERG